MAGPGAGCEGFFLTEEAIARVSPANAQAFGTVGCGAGFDSKTLEGNDVTHTVSHLHGSVHLVPLAVCHETLAYKFLYFQASVLALAFTLGQLWAKQPAGTLEFWSKPCAPRAKPPRAPTRVAPEVLRAQQNVRCHYATPSWPWPVQVCSTMRRAAMRTCGLCPAVGATYLVPR